MFTLGYFAYDLVIILFVVRDKSAVTQQLIIHHVVSSLTFSFSLIEGKHLVALSQSVMLCEISTLFLNIRYSMGKDAEGLFPLVNSTCLFLSFTFTRVTYFPMHINAHFQSMRYYDPFAQSPLHVFAWCFVLILFTAVWFLNLYWYQFMVKGFTKVLCPPKEKVKTDRYGVDINKID